MLAGTLTEVQFWARAPHLCCSGTKAKKVEWVLMMPDLVIVATGAGGNRYLFLARQGIAWKRLPFPRCTARPRSARKTFYSI